MIIDTLLGNNSPDIRQLFLFNLWLMFSYRHLLLLLFLNSLISQNSQNIQPCKF